jgi:2-keto-3-deoxy-L-rhamnonate aldolase RhmA
LNPNPKSSNNNLKSSLSHGDVVVGTFVMEFAVPQIATILASAGADFIIIDMEHTTFTMQTVGQIIRAARGSNLPSIVRVARIIWPTVCMVNVVCSMSIMMKSAPALAKIVAI